MKIILLKDYPQIGKKGGIFEVKDGLARNLLIPKGIATELNLQLESKIIKEKLDAEAKKIRTLQASQNLKTEIEKKVFTLSVAVNPQGNIFGSVKSSDIIEVINKKLGTHFNTKDLINFPHIKQLGSYFIQLKLKNDLYANIHLNIQKTIN